MLLVETVCSGVQRRRLLTFSLLLWVDFFVDLVLQPDFPACLEHLLLFPQPPTDYSTLRYLRTACFTAQRGRPSYYKRHVLPKVEGSMVKTHYTFIPKMYAHIQCNLQSVSNSRHSQKYTSAVAEFKHWIEKTGPCLFKSVAMITQPTTT
jgi:hypothetical protein